LSQFHLDDDEATSQPQISERGKVNHRTGLPRVCVLPPFVRFSCYSWLT
jgi:hypothetical protein